MLSLGKVAVTGGLSCGKSSVCLILKDCGAYVVSADKIAHQLLSSDTNLGQEVVKLLGSDILVNQKIDRSRIAQIVFHHVELLRELEALIHPAVYEEIDREYQIQKNRVSSSSLFVAEVPLLFESGGEVNFDYTIAVVSELDNCFKRFSLKTGYDRSEFDRRMKTQLPLFEKALLADYVIENNGTLQELEAVTSQLYQELKKK